MTSFSFSKARPEPLAHSKSPQLRSHAASESPPALPRLLPTLLDPDILIFRLDLPGCGLVLAKAGGEATRLGSITPKKCLEAA
jgi:hypothetical protein